MKIQGDAGRINSGHRWKIGRLHSTNALNPVLKQPRSMRKAMIILKKYLFWKPGYMTRHSSKWLDSEEYASRPPGEVHGPFKADQECIIIEVSYPSQAIGWKPPVGKKSLLFKLEGGDSFAFCLIVFNPIRVKQRHSNLQEILTCRFGLNSCLLVF